MDSVYQLTRENTSGGWQCSDESSSYANDIGCALTLKEKFASDWIFVHLTFNSVWQQYCLVQINPNIYYLLTLECQQFIIFDVQDNILAYCISAWLVHVITHTMNLTNMSATRFVRTFLAIFVVASIWHVMIFLRLFLGLFASVVDLLTVVFQSTPWNFIFEL